MTSNARARARDLLEQPGVKAVAVYDGRCRFCMRWVARWQARTRGRVEYVAYQEPGVLQRLGIPLAEARRSVQLVLPDGRRFTGAEAVFRLILMTPGRHPLVWLGRLPLLRWIAERFYRFVANHRVLASKVDRVMFSRRSEPRRYEALRP